MLAIPDPDIFKSLTKFITQIIEQIEPILNRPNETVQRDLLVALVICDDALA